MNRFNLPELIAILREFNMAQSTLRNLKDTPLASINAAPLLSMCERANLFCMKVGFHHSGKKAWSLGQRIKVNFNDYDGSMLLGELLSLQEDLSVEMYTHKFVQVHPSAHGLLDNEFLFGKEVGMAFPLISGDLREAGNCLALDCSTAGVFHLMRVIEIALWAFAKHAGLKSVVIDRKSGRSIPVEYGQWEQVLNQLPNQIEKKINGLRKGRPQKDHAQQFYYGALKELDHFKDAFRNHVSHSRRFYDASEARAVYSHVSRFMQSLAENGVKSGRKKRGV
ncbi:MAG TPA: hypothetical protein VHW46_05300 [Terracidiphilus sp.]|jgi:hypothetical protein|nr:hypothetical protein [Terracidiphilus sp.]